MVVWRYRDTVLMLCTFAFFSITVVRFAISPLAPNIVDTFVISNTAFGLALSGMWLAYGAAQYPSGFLGDRYGEREIILVAVGGSTLAAVSLVFSPLFALFSLALILLGATAGLHYSVATTLLSRTHKHIGTAIGVHNAGATVAGLLTPVVVSWIAIRFGWRMSLASVALVGIPVTIAFGWKVRSTEPLHPGTPIRERFEFSHARSFFSRPPIVFTLGLATIGEFVWQGTTSFLPIFLIEHRGTSTTAAAGLFSAYFLVQVLAQIGVGVVSDRLGRDRVIGGCFMIGVFGFGMLILLSSPLSTIVGVALVGIAMSFGPGLMPRFIGELSPDEQNTGFGLVRSVYMISASAGSVVVGLLADLLGWTISFGFLAVALLIACILLVVNWLLQFGY